MEIPPQNSPYNKKKEEGVGPMVGIVIIVVLMIIGGIYFLVTKEMNPQTTPPAQEQSNS